MSPRAALRLEHLGFERAYDYVPGKTDWMAAGLPREGKSAAIPQPGDIARRSVPTRHFRAKVGETLERMRAEGHKFCVAVDESRIVLGMLLADKAQDSDPSATVESVMQPGPTTVRASEPLVPLLGRMEKAGVDVALVTNLEGRLLGVLHRSEAKQYQHGY